MRAVRAGVTGAGRDERLCRELEVDTAGQRKREEGGWVLEKAAWTVCQKHCVCGSGGGEAGVIEPLQCSCLEHLNLGL